MKKRKPITKQTSTKWLAKYLSGAVTRYTKNHRWINLNKL